MRSKVGGLFDIRRRQRAILPPWWRRHPWLASVMVVVVVACVATRRSIGPASSVSDHDRYHRGVFSVADVIDGDTVDLAVRDGTRRGTRVRFWGVDTPEVAGSRRGGMVFGAQASAFAKAELSGRKVEVWLVDGKTRDRYDRLLAYLKRPEDEVSFNERIISTGHGYADWRFDHPYMDRFRQAEERARRQRVGLWGIIRTDQMPGWRQRMPPKRRDSAPATSRASRHTPASIPAMP